MAQSERELSSTGFNHEPRPSYTNKKRREDPTVLTQRNPLEPAQSAQSAGAVSPTLEHEADGDFRAVHEMAAAGGRSERVIRTFDEPVVAESVADATTTTIADAGTTIAEP